MRLLTKAEACRELGLSLSTLDRRIAAGELQAKREPRGRRHRVYVMLDDEPPGNGGDVDYCETAQAVSLGVPNCELFCGRFLYKEGGSRPDDTGSDARSLRPARVGGFFIPGVGGHVNPY